MSSRNPSAIAHGPSADIRQATVVKCDVVGSTHLKRSLDADGLLAFKKAWEAAVAEVVRDNGGHLETFEGDGALVLFGHPEPREDMAERAVSMGLRLVDKVQSVRIGSNPPLQVRVGIASGPIVAVKHAWTPKSESITGLTIDIAERLRALASPGQVVIADATRHLAGRFFNYVDLGIHPVKGFEEGVHAWRVDAASSIVSRFDARQPEAAFLAIVGRDAELQTLDKAWSDALAGHGRALRLVGDAGMGKSRLAREALARAERDRAEILEVDCTPSTGNSPLFPIGVLFRGRAGISGNTAPAEKRAKAEALLGRFLARDEVSRALAYVAPLFGVEGIPLPSDVSPNEVRDRTVDAVLQMLRVLAAQTPVAMLCEDLHWVDPTTGQIITRIANEIRNLRALLIVTLRPTKKRPPVELGKFTQIALPPLGGPAAAALVRSVAGTRMSDAGIRAIVDAGEGTPLVLEELTREALERAEEVGNPTATRSPAEQKVSPLQLVVQWRMGRLPKLDYLVQAAAVLGRELSLRVLNAVVGGDGSAAFIDSVNALASESLLERPASNLDDRVRFKHALIREAVYNTLLKEDRRRLHSVAADALRSARYADTPDAAPDVVARHLSDAGRFAEAIRVHLAASADTAARGAYAETEGHCNAALAIIDHLEDPAERRTLQFQLLLRLAVAVTGRHGYSAPEVEIAYSRVQEACGESAEAETLYPVLRGFTAFNLVRGNLAKGRELSEQALRIAERSRSAAFRIDAMSVHCYATLYYGTLDECRTWIRRCLRVYRRERGGELTYPVPNDACTAALALLPTVEWLMGDAAAAEKAVTEGLAHVASLGREFDAAMMHCWIAGTRYTQRRNAEALQHAMTGVTIAQRQGYEEWLGVGSLLACMAQAAMQPAPEALQQASAICKEFERQGVGLNASYYLWGIARGFHRAGDATTAQFLVGEGFKCAAASGDTRMNPELMMLQAELESDAAAASRLLRDALALATEQGAIANALRAAAMLQVRVGGSEDELHAARAALAVLNGEAKCPMQPEWMAAQLAAIGSRNIDEAR